MQKLALQEWSLLLQIQLNFVPNPVFIHIPLDFVQVYFLFLFPPSNMLNNV